MAPEPRDTPSGGRGRPGATTHAQIERAAFALFAEHGFEGTTIEAIAREVGVGTRTIFRYFPSKNDIAWGRFAETLRELERVLDESPDDQPIHDVVRHAVLAFNRFPADAHPTHRDRMRLILTTPDLQAHSVHQYAAWRRVIATYVARRLGVPPDDLVPVLAGQVSLALALTAYELWLRDQDADVVALLDEAMSGLRSYLRV